MSWREKNKAWKGYMLTLNEGEWSRERKRFAEKITEEENKLSDNLGYMVGEHDKFIGAPWISSI